MLYFDWDSVKAASNLAKHKISFGAARKALEDPHAIEWEDQIIEGELRSIATGMAQGEVIVTVCYTLESGAGSVDETAKHLCKEGNTAGKKGL
jgi:hypothetical protein